jgi:hypothetical protein
MKKLIAVSILLTLLSAAAFAENEDAGGKLLPGFHVGLRGEFQPDLLKATAPTGDAANVDKTGAYAGNGTFDFLTANDTWKDSDLDVWLTFADPEGKFAGRLDIDAKKWIKYLANSGYDNGVGSGVSGGSGTKDDGKADDNQSVLGFLNVPFGDWDLWGKVGIFRGFAGNTAQRGVVARYENVANIFVDKFKIDNYGIITPFGKHLDMNNLRRHISASSTAYATEGGNAYLSLQANLDPITVDVATEMGTFFPLATAGEDSYSAAGGAFRVSAKGIADIVDFDVIYKLRSVDPTTDTNLTSPKQPDGKGIWEHAFGLYANLNIIDGLGIGLGYSGSVRAQETDTNAGDIRTEYPYLNGIDLRFKLSMIEKLTVTFNNNISFSAVTNDDDLKTDKYGVLYTTAGFTNSGTRDKEYKDSYLALYNHLALSYAITDALSANVSIGNKLLAYNSTDDHDETKQIVTDITTDEFMGTAYAAYSFTRNVSMQAGLAFKVTGNTWKQTDQTAMEDGLFTFGIPIRFAIRF